MASDCVSAAVAWYGVFDFATIAAQARQSGAFSRAAPAAPEWRLLGCSPATCRHGEIAVASAVRYVNRRTAPKLLIVGDQDCLVPSRQTLEMAARMTAAGAPHRLLVLPGVGHRLIGATPERTRSANLEALAVTFRYFDQALGR